MEKDFGLLINLSISLVVVLGLGLLTDPPVAAFTCESFLMRGSLLRITDESYVTCYGVLPLELLD